MTTILGFLFLITALTILVLWVRADGFSTRTHSNRWNDQGPRTIGPGPSIRIS